MKKETLTKILTYCGSLPFIFLTYLKILGINDFFAIEVSKMIISYGAVILSFIAGIHFSYAILQEKFAIKFLIFSNIVALLCWLSLLINFKSAVALMLICCFSNIVIDFVAYKKHVIEKWFFDLRLRISLIVMICLLVNFGHIF
ncbi:MAG: hypothetical protein ACJAS6_001187 [Rickettsiales bacterium]|jgi:hypothetical protein